MAASQRDWKSSLTSTGKSSRPNQADDLDGDIAVLEAADESINQNGLVGGTASIESGSNGEPKSITSRLFRPQTILSFVAALAILVFFFRRLNINYHEVWANIKNANPAFFFAAAAVYYGAFIIRAVRWRMMLARAGIDGGHGYAVPDTPRLIDIFLQSWFLNCIVPAKLGDGYRSYLLKRDCKAPFSTSLGTILAERLVDLVVLFSTMSVMGVIAFRGKMPSQADNTIIGGAILLVIGGLAVAILWFFRDHLERFIPQKFHEQYRRLHDAIFACLRRPGTFAAISAVIWGCDGLRLFLVAKSLGADISLPMAVFVALMSSLVTTLPITPAGLGIVEVTMVAVLKVGGVPASMGGSIAILDRVITYWSLILIGAILYVRQLHRDVIKPGRAVDSAPAQ